MFKEGDVRNASSFERKIGIKNGGNRDEEKELEEKDERKPRWRKKDGETQQGI